MAECIAGAADLGLSLLFFVVDCCFCCLKNIAALVALREGWDAGCRGGWFGLSLLRFVLLLKLTERIVLSVLASWRGGWDAGCRGG